MIDLSYLRDQSQAPCTYLPKLTKKFLRAEGSVHFRVENIYGRELPFFTRFMPTNGFVQPFVGIISFCQCFMKAVTYFDTICTPRILFVKRYRDY